MLVSLHALAADASTGWQPFSTSQAAAETASSHLRSEDPTTLTLALIGAATLAVYFAVRRNARHRAGTLVEAVAAPTVVAGVAASGEAASKTAVEKRSRGAA